MFSYFLWEPHIFSVRATDGVQLQFGVNWQAVVLKNLFRLYSNVYEIAFQCVMRHSISCINPHAVSQFVLTRSLVTGVTWNSFRSNINGLHVKAMFCCRNAALLKDILFPAVACSLLNSLIKEFLFPQCTSANCLSWSLQLSVKINK